MTNEDTIPLMLRLPRELHEQVKRFSQGDAKRPKSSLNATIIFLLEAGLKAQQAQAEPERIAA